MDELRSSKEARENFLARRGKLLEILKSEHMEVPKGWTADPVQPFGKHFGRVNEGWSLSTEQNTLGMKLMLLLGYGKIWEIVGNEAEHDLNRFTPVLKSSGPSHPSKGLPRIHPRKKVKIKPVGNF